MAKGYVLYNPKAGSGAYMNTLDTLEIVMDDELVFQDITHITNYRAFLSGLEDDDYLLLAGGDGTLNRFINDTDGLNIPNEIFYYPAGNSNDFARDLQKQAGDNPFPITSYFKKLPYVQVRGKKYRFLNGVGYGIDGYCCEIGDRLHRNPGKKGNYMATAIKGLLLHYKPTNAKITVDGVTHTYKKVWLAPTMNGRCYGGGLIPTPVQDRTNAHKTLSVMVMHNCGRLKALTVYPSIFTGTHVKYKKQVDILTGHEITVEFDSPTALQIDGESIPGVSSYTAVSAIHEKAHHPGQRYLFRA